MAKITLDVGGRNYDMHCRDGEEDHLRGLAAVIDSKCTQASDALGVMSEARQLLTAALLIADELHKTQKREADIAAENNAANGDASTNSNTATPEQTAELGQLAVIAEQIEILCSALEKRVEKA